MATNRLRHFNGCSIEELEPSHLQPRDECPAIDGLSCCSIGTCGHMRPPSKGWLLVVAQGGDHRQGTVRLVPGTGGTVPWNWQHRFHTSTRVDFGCQASPTLAWSHRTGVYT